MKRTAVIISCVFLCVLLCLPSSAKLGVEVPEGYVDPFVDGIGDISLPKGSPTIDGDICEGEGWSAAALIDKTNTDGAWGGEEVRCSMAFYRCWDEDGLYFAADIAAQFLPENYLDAGCKDIILSTGRDDIDSDKESTVAGWNGDVFMLALDANDALLDAGLAKEAPAWYCIGIFEGNVLRMYREQINEGEITDQVAIYGSLTESGWKFEAFIPWEIIIKDLNDKGEISLKKEDVVKDGSRFTTGVIYQDRMYDGEGCENATYSRYITIGKVLRDGSDGTLSPGWCLYCYGMFMNMVDANAEDLKETDAVVTDQYNNDITKKKSEKKKNDTEDTTAEDSETANSTDTTAKENDKVGTDTKEGTGVNENKVTADLSGSTTSDTDRTYSPETEKTVSDNSNNTAESEVSLSGSNGGTEGSGTVTKPQTKSESTASGSTSAQTFDAGIVLSGVVMAISALGAGLTKKRK